MTNTMCPNLNSAFEEVHVIIWAWTCLERHMLQSEMMVGLLEWLVMQFKMSTFLCLMIMKHSLK